MSNTEEPRRRLRPVEKVERELLGDIAAATAPLAKNGEVVTAATPPMAARIATVQAGMAEMQAIVYERDQALARAAKAEAECANLLNLADQAKEGERLRLKEVSDRAIAEGRAAQAEAEVLKRECADLRTRLATSDTQTQVALAEAAKYKTLALVLRASIDKVLPAAPASP